jgi:murein DD-endopeptidase MepM/ murein hydrolase activator NlpD
LVIARTVGSDYALSVAALVFAIAAGYVVARLHGRVYGWMLAFVLLTLQVFASVLL